MLPTLTGMIVGGLRVLAIPRHLHALALKAVLLPPRGGTTGGYWGMAHGAVVMLVGLLLLSVRRLLAVETPAWGGLLLGLGLILFGLITSYRVSKLLIHSHPHTHEGATHDHIHLHEAPEQIHAHDLSALAMVDGALSVSNLIAALPVLVLTEQQAILYLVMYLVFSVLAMGGFGRALGRSSWGPGDTDWVQRATTIVSNTAVVVGVVWIIVRWPAG